MLSIEDFVSELSADHPEDAEDLGEALQVLRQQKINSLERLAKLTDGQWQRLGIPLGIEALLKEEAEATLASASTDSEAGKEQTQQERLSTKPLHSELLYRLYQHNLRHSETPGSLMLARWLWLLWHARARAQDPSCWDAQFTAELCCDLQFGPTGNEGCWDSVHTFARCCGEPKQVQEEDCRDSKSFDSESCCDLLKGDRGDEACWTGSNNFENCCDSKLAHNTREMEAAPVFGAGCWDHEEHITWPMCCGSRHDELMQRTCWSGEFTYDRCCDGLVPIPRIYLQLPRDDDLVQCAAKGAAEVSLSLSKRQCSGRYFNLAGVANRLMDSDVQHSFWWQRRLKTDMHRAELYSNKSLQVMRPRDLVHMGSLCVPSSCSEDAVAGWFASKLERDHNAYTPPKLIELNATHVRLSPLRAVRRPYPRFTGSWISWRSQHSDDARKTGAKYVEFILLEHRSWRQLRPSQQTAMVLLALAIPVLFASAIRAAGPQVMSGLALQTSVGRLFAPRPLCYDVCRILTTLFVIAIHVKDHYPFPEVTAVSTPFEQMAVGVKAVPVNQLAILLMVYLSLRRLEPKSLGPLAWLWRVFCYALRRWALMLSVVGIWLYVYLEVLVKDVPIPNLGKTKFLELWFSEKRDECSRMEHLLPSVFLLHEAFHLKPTPCHNLGIFEACWQVDVVTFSLMTLPGLSRSRWLTAGLAAMMFLPAAFSSSAVAERGAFLFQHRLGDLLAPALAAVFFAALLPRAELLEPRPVLRFLLSTMAFAVTSAGILLIAAAHLGWLPRAPQIPDGVMQNLMVLPSMVGVLLMLRIAEASPPHSKGLLGRLLNALGRLSPGINLSHLFVAQMHLGYSESPIQWFRDLPPSPVLFFSTVALLFVVSTVVSMLVFVLVEGPVQALVGYGGYGGHGTSETLPSGSVTRMTTNGAANGHTSVANGCEPTVGGYRASKTVTDCSGRSISEEQLEAEDLVTESGLYRRGAGRVKMEVGRESDTRQAPRESGLLGDMELSPPQNLAELWHELLEDTLPPDKRELLQASWDRAANDSERYMLFLEYSSYLRKQAVSEEDKAETRKQLEPLLKQYGLHDLQQESESSGSSIWFMLAALAMLVAAVIWYSYGHAETEIEAQSL
ncbi:unnamed protein product [Symbiodinium sp. KB8]|nr:unnamed protein product [Symbiodinium sp. KB8]